MPKLSEQVLIPHKRADLFELVRDVRRYPEFIKWIRQMQVSEEAEEGGLYTCLGEARVSFKGFDEVFATHVKADTQQNRIDVNLKHGPFRHLRNRWQFDERPDGRTRVHFFIDYEFRNPMLALLARTNSRLAVDRIITAFRTEADRRYRAATA